ncbi:MAG: hypothetical protein H0T45_03120 [Pyrinomonadaceae bacterium]|nr:hypothetical protein [Pyrinomonadaceae bacterium]
MTTEEHNKALGIMHLAYGGINFLTLLLVAVVFMFSLSADPGIPWETSLITLVVSLGFVFGNLFLTVPNVLAGYALLKRKSWAKVPALVAAVLAILNIPLGSALAFYTFWFLFGEGGRRYQNGWSNEYRYALNEAPPPPAHDWITERAPQQRTREYAPPPQPPNWRS